MQSFHLSFEYSAWWLLPIVLVSAALALLMYSGPTVWSKRLRQILASLRFLVLFLVLFLLINPQLTFTKSFKEKPVFPLVVDNSRSIPLAANNEKEIKETLVSAKKTLENKGFEVPVLGLDKRWANIDSLTFTYPSSDLSKLLLQAEKRIAKTKDAKFLFLSDGIFNSGASPVYESYRPSIFTLGLGDTVPRKDLVLKSVQNNSVAFMGNKFTIRAEIKSVGYKNSQAEVILRGSKNNVIEKQTIQIRDENWLSKLDFIVPADQKGYQRYTIEIMPLKGESNLMNNKQSAYIDIIDDRENVLLVSNSPHPNIKAIRSALGHLENIHLDVFIQGFEEPKQTAYDLVILHNCVLANNPQFKKFVKEGTSLFYIAGAQSNFSLFNAENGIIEIQNQQHVDQVQGLINPSFSKFKLKEELSQLLSKLPPIEVPFGDMKARPGTEVVLYQQVNSVSSNKPLLLFGQSTRKTGVLLSDGLWLWRMHEAQSEEVTTGIDELITKTIQLLSGKEDKRKFRIYPHQKEYFEGEETRVEVELYNDLYEKVYGQKTTLQITSVNGSTIKYEFTPSEGSSALSTSQLPTGVYKVNASCTYSGKSYTATTEFIVKERQLEALDLQANHNLLRQLSKKTKGSFYALQNREKLLKELEQLTATPIWKSEETTKELIDEKWYYALIVILIAAEWITRRYTGGY